MYRLLKAVLFFMCRYLIVMLLTSGKNSLQCTILIYCDPKTQAHTFYIIYIKKRSFNSAFKHTTTLFNFLLQKKCSCSLPHRNALSSMHILLSLLANILHSKYLSRLFKSITASCYKNIVFLCVQDLRMYCYHLSYLL